MEQVYFDRAKARGTIALRVPFAMWAIAPLPQLRPPPPRDDMVMEAGGPKTLWRRRENCRYSGVTHIRLQLLPKYPGAEGLTLRLSGAVTPGGLPVCPMN
jgi:hypothetical protein